MAEQQDPLLVPVLTPFERENTMADTFDNTLETVQAQHSRSNDSPTDVNNNAVLARSQALTIDVLGKSFESNADRRDKIFDAVMAKNLTTA